MTEVVVARENPHLQAAPHSMLGIRALFAEMADQGIEPAALLVSTGLVPAQLDDSKASLTLAQKIAIFRNVRRLSRVPDVGLRAGARQRLSDFGVYGYALVSSTTFGEAVLLGVRQVKLAGPVLEKRFRVEGDTAIFEGHDVLALDEVLPIATEFWFASVLRLGTCILEAPFPSRRLLLPYARPAHAPAYERMFGCPVEFGADVMEWHFDARVLSAACPNANPITADICQEFCSRILASLPDEFDLPRNIRAACLNSRGAFPNADEMAARLGLSVRTLHRRLSEQGQPYQRIVDDVRRALASEFLLNTTLTIEDIAGRVGFTEGSNFRKAFTKWTGCTPAHFRATATGGPSGQAGSTSPVVPWVPTVNTRAR